MTNSDLMQRVMARLPWELYMRLKAFSKMTRRNIVDDILPKAIEQYLDRQDRAEQEGRE